MSVEAASIAEAAVRAFEWPLSVAESHQDIDIGALITLTLHLRTRLAGRPERDPGASTVDVEAVFRDTADGTNDIAGIGDARASVLRRLVLKKEILLVEESDGYRLSRRTDLGNEALFSGVEVVAAPTPEASRRMLAHNHLLLYPEALYILRAFAPPGATKASAKRQADRFRFCRKLNDTNATFCVTELEALNLVRPSGGGLLAVSPVPPCVAAFNVVEAALQVADYRLDRQVKTQLLVQQLVELVVGAEQIVRENMVHRHLGAPEPVLRHELAGAQVRLTRSSFHWLVRRGMVDPLSVGRVLRAEGDVSALALLATALMPKVRTLSPSNISDYESVFVAGLEDR